VVQKNPRGLKLQCSHYRPCVVTSRDGRLPCVIYCHTNSGSRRDAEEIAFAVLPQGCTVFALDFSVRACRRTVLLLELDASTQLRVPTTAGGVGYWGLGLHAQLLSY